MEGQKNKERKVFSSKNVITKLTFENIYLRVAVSFNIHLKVFRLKVRQTGEQDLTTNIKRELLMSEFYQKR